MQKNNVKGILRDLEKKDATQAEEQRNRLEEIEQSFDEKKTLEASTKEQMEGKRQAMQAKANKLNQLYGDIRNIIKHGQLLSPEERLRRSTLSGMEKIISKERKQRIEREKARKEKEKREKPMATLAAKLAAASETPPELSTPEPETTEVGPTVKTSLAPMIKMIDDNIDDLDPEMATYAKDLASQAETPEQEDEARKALDAALEGYTLEEYQSSMKESIFDNDKPDLSTPEEREKLLTAVENEPEIPRTISEKIIAAFEAENPEQPKQITDTPDSLFDDAQENLNPAYTQTGPTQMFEPEKQPMKEVEGGLEDVGATATTLSSLKPGTNTDPEEEKRKEALKNQTQNQLLKLKARRKALQAELQANTREIQTTGQMMKTLKESFHYELSNLFESLQLDELYGAGKFQAQTLSNEKELHNGGKEWTTNIAGDEIVIEINKRFDDLTINGIKIPTFSTEFFTELEGGGIGYGSTNKNVPMTVLATVIKAIKNFVFEKFDQNPELKHLAIEYKGMTDDEFGIGDDPSKETKRQKFYDKMIDRLIKKGEFEGLKINRERLDKSSVLIFSRPE
jgi:hypothetical protein